MSTLPNLICPLCGQPNDCALARTGRHDADCWCRHTQVDPAALARVPEEARQRACLCRRCAGIPPATTTP